MTKVLVWVKSNPITVASAAVAVVAVIVLASVEWQRGTFIEKVQDRAAVIRRLEGLLRTPVRVPPLEPDQEEREEKIAVNQAAIDELARVYGQMNQDYNRIRNDITRFNQQSHQPMINGLFPRPSEEGMQYEGRNAYRAAFMQMLAPPTPGNEQALPGLNAGAEMSGQRMTEALQQAQDRFLNTQIFPPKRIEELNDEERNRLDRFKLRALLEVLKAHAEAIHLYTGHDLDLDSSEFPFDVAPWSKQGHLPSMDEIWRGQMSLWIQQDIARAIARLNHTDDPSWNVMRAPIKKLVKIAVAPGYVGLPDLPAGLAGAPASGPPVNAGGYFASADPQGSRAAPNRGRDPKAQQTNRFDLSPSGRVSNDVYDVIHCKVVLVIDSRYLGAFIDEIQSVNLMTVLQVDLEDIDEYDAIRSGHVYGSPDVIQAKLIVETVWLREWTSPMMPPSVRKALGLAPPPPAPGPPAATGRPVDGPAISLHEVDFTAVTALPGRSRSASR